ncbi:phage minor head protein [Pseudorhodoplanes sp.]|uniref:phage minor head protein n=1 Tax=Pseudorhodoplanes sp. TaxID=1934341 RepID=UPI002BB1AE0E|nr:phage minor head protein [Pseudorhodoplanes sp.]HWV44127.1 phage minor head protein [Pseudorhodoplanes sp.]
MAANRWDQLIDQWDATLRKAFLDSVYRLRDQAQLDAISRALERGDVNGALRAVGLDPASFRAWDKTFEAAFEAGGTATVSALPVLRDAAGYRLVVQFNIRNPQAEAWLRNHSSTLVREILDDQRDMIRTHLANGMARGVNPRTSALDLVGRIGATGRREGGVIGLTSSQAEWVRRYEAELASDAPGAALARELRDRRFDAAVRRAADAGEPVPASIRAKMVTAYRNRALRFRAEALARTEAMAALHTAQDEAINQAVSAGAIDQTAVTFAWRTARDKRVRDSHKAMEGQTRPMGVPFRSGSGAMLRYPGDPSAPASERINCRCWREPVVDFLANVA